jgi:N-glycosylase/DNA lyase
MSDFEKREWLVNNVSGLGMKSSSHFLRNQGAKNLAIIDTHIIKFMDARQPRTKNEYLQIESAFTDTAKSHNFTVAELDALVWKVYSKTPWSEFKF